MNFINKGRGQRAEGFYGFIPSPECPNHRKGRTEQGFKTPTKLKIWWFLFRRGWNPLGEKNLLPSAFFNKPRLGQSTVTINIFNKAKFIVLLILSNYIFVV